MTTQDIHNTFNELSKKLEDEHFEAFYRSDLCGKKLSHQSFSAARKQADLAYSYQVFITGFRLGQKCQNTQPEAQ